MTDAPLTGKVGLDVTDFKAGVAALNREIRVIESGFRAVAAGMGDWDKQSGGLEARIKALTGQIDLQKSKVAAIAGEYRRVAQAQGEDSKAAQDLQIRLNKETETLGRMQTELRQADTALQNMGKESKTTGDRTNDLKGHEDRAVISTEHLGRAMSGLAGHLKSAAAGMVSLIGHVAKLAAGLAVGLAGAATAAAAGLGALAVSTIGPASDLNETVSKVNVVFGEAAANVIQFGQNAATGLGMSTNAALTAAGTYGNLFRAMGMNNQVSADMSVNLVKLAGDLASFNNLSPEDVLEKLRSGLSGETEPLKSLGVNINEAAIKAQALKMGLKEVNGVLDPAARAQAAYALIMKQTTLAQGDFTRTSGGLANQQRILASQIENLRAKIGTALLPIVTRATQLLNQFLASPTVQAGIDTLTTKIGEFGAKLQDTFTKLSTGNFRGAMNDIFGREMTDRIFGAKDAIGGLVDKVRGLWSAFKTGGVGGLLDNLLPKGSGGNLAGTIGGLIGKALTGAAAKPAQILQIGLDLVNSLTGAIVTAIPALLPVGMQIITAFITFITTSLPALITQGLTILMTLIQGLFQAIPTLMPVVLQIITSLVQFLVQNLPMLITTGIQLIVTLATGIAQALPQLIPAILEIIPKVVLTLLQNLPQLIQAALQLILALAQGLVNAIPVLLPYLPQIITAIVDGLVPLMPMLLSAALQIITTLAAGILANLPVIAKTVGDIVGAMIAEVPKLSEKLNGIGKSLIDGLWNGLKGAWADFKSKLEGLINLLPESVKKILGIASPSKVFAGIGANMAAGLGAGFANEFQSLKDKVAGAVGSLGGVNVNAGIGTAQLQPAPATVVNQYIQPQLGNELDYRKLARYVAQEMRRAR